MARLYFLAHFEPGADGSFGVFFPDLPGATSAGDTFEHALSNAVEALQLHIDGMREDGEPIPEPGRAGDWPSWAGRKPKGIRSALIPVEVAEAAVRLNITMDKGLLARIDRIAQAEGMTRSGFLAQAAREKLAREKLASAGGRKPKKAA